MFLLWWCPFKIWKEKRADLQFTSTDYLSIVLTPVRIRWTVPLKTVLQNMQLTSFIYCTWSCLKYLWFLQWLLLCMLIMYLTKNISPCVNKNFHLPVSGSTECISRCNRMEGNTTILYFMMPTLADFSCNLWEGRQCRFSRLSLHTEHLLHKTGNRRE
jgi:hypothetical protein